MPHRWGCHLRCNGRMWVGITSHKANGSWPRGQVTFPPFTHSDHPKRKTRHYQDSVAYMLPMFACLFFSFKHNWKIYLCILIQWFVPISDLPCEDTGMWEVEPDMDGQRTMSHGGRACRVSYLWSTSPPCLWPDIYPLWFTSLINTVVIPPFSSWLNSGLNLNLQYQI